MATTVNNAFAEFMKEKVNLDQEKTKTARSSRDNLLDNIKGFSGDVNFFAVYKDKILRFGSFERRTKIRPIDDINLLWPSFFVTLRPNICHRVYTTP